VPQDWWELVFKVGEVFALLSAFCEKQKCRWILVLDGLDRLAEDDQQALPWIPTTLPLGIHVVASALDCSARTILQQRQYRTHEIGPLGNEEQQQLIERYLSRYTKQLESGLQQKILEHKLASSPLFLKVLLEELRQCAWYDNLAEELEFYLTAGSIDGLYEKVLERLEGDGHGEATRKALTALWASRAGLSETELLEITRLAPLEWVPVDLALSEAFRRNGERLLFDHDYLKNAISIRYLPGQKDKKQAHSLLADWFADLDGWDARDSEELPWQLMQAGQLEELCDWLLVPGILAQLQWDRGSRETIYLWLAVKAKADGELDELIAEDVEKEIEARQEDASVLISFIDRIADVLDQAGLYRKLLLRLRTLSLELEDKDDNGDEASNLITLSKLAGVHYKSGNYVMAEPLYLRCLEARECLLGPEHPDTLANVGNLGELYKSMGDYAKAETFHNRALEAQERLLGPEHPNTLANVGNLGALYKSIGDYAKAEAFFNRALEAQERLHGPEHPATLITVGNLGVLYVSKGDYAKAEPFLCRDLEASERLLGPEHPSTVTAVGNLGVLYESMGDYAKAEAFFCQDLEASERLLGPEHPDTLVTVGNLGALYKSMGDYAKAEAFYNRALEAQERLLGPEHPNTLLTVGNLGELYESMGDYEQAEAFYKRDLEASERLLGPEHPKTLNSVGNLGVLYESMGDYAKAEAFYNRALEAQERLLGPEHPNTLLTVGNLAGLFKDRGDYAQAEAFYNRCLEARERLLGPEHPKTLNSVYLLAETLSDSDRRTEAIPLRRRELTWCRQQNSDANSGTLDSINGLAIDLRETGELEEAEKLFRELLAAQQQGLEPSDSRVGRRTGDDLLGLRDPCGPLPAERGAV